MNKKILIGSIIAVAILVLVSFTGVVGYQTTKSSTIARASPLFTVRSSRAIDGESQDLSCDYVGKGEENTISLPTRVGRTTSLQKAQRFIDLISKMDDKTFNRFICSVIRNGCDKNIIKEKQIPEVLPLLYQLKDNSQALRNSGNSTLHFYTFLCKHPLLLLLVAFLILCGTKLIDFLCEVITWKIFDVIHEVLTMLHICEKTLYCAI